MRLKRLLLAPLIFSVVLFVYFSRAVAHSFSVVAEYVALNPEIVVVIVVAVCLQIMGHIIRAYKMSFLLAPVKTSTPRFQFRALSIGYLFDALLPLRLGELIRAQVIASGEKISLGFALSLIVIERALDALTLALIGAILLVAGAVPVGSLGYVAGLSAVSISLCAMVAILGRANTSLLPFVHKFSALFNESIKLGIRFKVWSVIYGLQRIVTKRRMVYYLGLTLLSWVFYVASALVVAQYIFGWSSSRDNLALAASPYFGVSIPSGPANLGSFSGVANAISGAVSLNSAERVIYNLLAWSVLIAPVSLLGIVFLFAKTRETIWRHLPRANSYSAMSDKLARSEDISFGLANFLDNYFSNNSLSRVVHRLELRKDFRLLGYFRGGSDAITILAMQNKKIVVKKIIAPELKDRLKAQRDWLVRRADTRGIVSVLCDYDDPSYYAIDLEYDEKNKTFFSYIHSNTIDESKRVLRTAWECLHQSIYAKTRTVHDPQVVEKYIQKHIFGCMDQAVLIDKSLEVAARGKAIRINGKKYHNLYQVIQKIQNNPQAMRDLSTYKCSREVHGDATVDNILVSNDTQQPLLIDPAPDGNLINGPVFDFGKMMQSLYCGYEFLLWSEETVSFDEKEGIRYQDHRSKQYVQLCDYVCKELAPKYLTEGEQKAMIFHAGVLHIRRLKHQVYQNPGAVLSMYAVGVIAFNDFLALYDH